MRRALILTVAMLLWSGLAAAQVRSVEVRAPRSFGYFLGDLIQSQVDIVVEKGFLVQAASLPKPGPINHWLALRQITTSQTPRGDATLVRLDLTYQSFYAALDARALEIPGFTLTVAKDESGGTTSAKAQVPHWSINVSPLQEVKPAPREDPADYLRPDARVAPIDGSFATRMAALLAGLALAATAALAYDRAWWPFVRREARAFASAERQIRRMRGEADETYRDALLAIHRGLDHTDKRRVLADDLSGFLDRHPAFRAQELALSRFFAASRLAFFGGGTGAARNDLPFPDIAATVHALATIERRA